MRDSSGGFAVYLYCVGDGRYQVFIKNNSADADFVRLAIGYAKRSNGRYIMQLDREWIISPLTVNDEHVYIADVTKQNLTGLRIWVAFEGVKRERKNITTGTYFVLSSLASRWPTSVGSLTGFEICMLQVSKNIKLLQNRQESTTLLQCQFTR